MFEITGGGYGLKQYLHLLPSIYKKFTTNKIDTYSSTGKHTHDIQRLFSYHSFRNVIGGVWLI